MPLCYPSGIPKTTFESKSFLLNHGERTCRIKRGSTTPPCSVAYCGQNNAREYIVVRIAPEYFKFSDCRGPLVLKAVNNDSAVFHCSSFRHPRLRESVGIIEICCPREWTSPFAFLESFLKKLERCNLNEGSELNQEILSPTASLCAIEYD